VIGDHHRALPGPVVVVPDAGWGPAGEKALRPRKYVPGTGGLVSPL